MNITFDLKEIDTLAPMPASVVQLATSAMDQKCSANEIAEIVEFDEALTANLLRLTNSVWGKTMTPIMTVKDAVVRLGTGHILKFAVGQQIARPMSSCCKGYEIEEHGLWKHSVCAALAAEQLSNYLFEPVPKLAYTAALMHDIGKILLSRYIDPNIIEDIRSIIKTDDLTFIEAEKKILGTDHSEIGGAIAEHWKFPPQLVTAISCHHDPDAAPDALLDIVYISNTVTKNVGVGLGAEGMNLKASQDAPKRRVCYS